MTSGYSVADLVDHYDENEGAKISFSGGQAGGDGQSGACQGQG